MAPENTKKESAKHDYPRGATSEPAHETTVEGDLKDSHEISENPPLDKDDDQNTANSDGANPTRRSQYGGSGSYDDSDRQSNHQHQNALSEKRAQELAAKDDNDKS